MPLACVLECSFLAAIIYLAILLVATRAKGTNKNPPEPEQRIAPAVASEPVAPQETKPSTPGEKAMMVAVAVGVGGALLGLAFLVSRWM